MNIKQQLRQHWWKWYNYGISSNPPIKIDFPLRGHWICQDFSWKCELYQMWCLNLVCFVISQRKPVSTCVPAIWFLLNEMKFNAQFQRDKQQNFKLSWKTDYNEQGDRILYRIVSHSCDYIWWLFSRSLIALLCDSQNTTNLLFPGMRASKYYCAQKRQILNESRTEILFMIKSYIFLQTWRTSKWNFQDNGTLFGKYSLLGCLFSWNLCLQQSKISRSNEPKFRYFSSLDSNVIIKYRLKLFWSFKRIGRRSILEILKS